VREMIEYRFRVPSAAVFTLYSYSKALEYRFRVPIVGSLISLYLEYIWPNEVYVHEVYDHTRPFMVVCMSSMQVYGEYMVILILYTIVVVF
jgi:hypothetical protein